MNQFHTILIVSLESLSYNTDCLPWVTFIQYWLSPLSHFHTIMVVSLESLTYNTDCLPFNPLTYNTGCLPWVTYIQYWLSPLTHLLFILIISFEVDSLNVLCFKLGFQLWRLNILFYSATIAEDFYVDDILNTITLTDVFSVGPYEITLYAGMVFKFFKYWAHKYTKVLN